MNNFIGLKSKLYSYLMDDGKNNKTCKGVRKYVIKKNITHENYKDVLFNKNTNITHNECNQKRVPPDWQLSMK